MLTRGGVVFVFGGYDLAWGDKGEVRVIMLGICKESRGKSINVEGYWIILINEKDAGLKSSYHNYSFPVQNGLYKIARRKYMSQLGRAPLRDNQWKPEAYANICQVFPTLKDGDGISQEPVSKHASMCGLP